MVEHIPYDFHNIAVIHYVNMFVEKDVESLLYTSKPLDRMGTREKMQVLDEVYRVMTMPAKQELNFLLQIEQDPVVRRRIKKMKTNWSYENAIHQKQNDLFTNWLENNDLLPHHDTIALDDIL